MLLRGIFGESSVWDELRAPTWRTANLLEELSKRNQAATDPAADEDAPVEAHLSSSDVRVAISHAEPAFRELMVGQYRPETKRHYQQVEVNANAERMPQEPTLEALHMMVARCLERPLDPAEERRLDAAYATLPLEANRSSVPVPGHRFEENWYDWLRLSAQGDGPTMLERLVMSEGRLGSQAQIFADINNVPLAGAACIA